MDNTRFENAKAKLLKMLDDADWEKVTIKHECGDEIIITPCGNGKLNAKNVEYFLCDSPELPWLGTDKIDNLVNELLGYEDLKKEHDEEKKKLAEYKTKMLNAKTADDFESMYDWYSDWHKDVYGYRPYTDNDIVLACRKWRQ